MNIRKLLGLVLLGGVGYAAYVYFTDKVRFCSWLFKLGLPTPSICDTAGPGPEPRPGPGPQPPSPPSPPSPPPPPTPPEPPTPPLLPTPSPCGEGEIFDPAKAQCVKLPIGGTGHCAEICSKYPFYSEADILRYIDRWTKSGTNPNDAEIALILDCWVKQGKCY